MILLIVFSGTGCKRETVAAAPGKLTIVVSGDTAGWITPCGCTANQSGGLLRRATFVASAQKAGETIYVDAGGAPGGVSDYQFEKFEAIIRGEMLMNVAAHNLGKPELALGIARLKETQELQRVPFVSANLVDDAGKPVFAEFRLVERGNVKVAIVGVVSPRLVAPPLKATDPRQAILDTLARHRSTIGDAAILVLAYAPEEELAQLAGSLPEMDAIVGGPTGQAIAPKRQGPVLLASATNKGKFLIRLEAAAHGAAWQGQVVEMNSAFTDDPGQLANLKSFHARLEQADFAAVSTGIVEPVPASAPPDFRIAGSASCASCHAEEQVVWAKSGHSHAMETLKKKGYPADSWCQSCHTTGFGLPGGFERMSTGAHFGVGCESCHGPSAAHVKESKRKTPWAAADQCVRCHDQENSPEFDYKSYWKQVAHGKNAGKTGRMP